LWPELKPNDITHNKANWTTPNNGNTSADTNLTEAWLTKIIADQCPLAAKNPIPLTCGNKIPWTY
jgi:hypothetical protein